MRGEEMSGYYGYRSRKTGSRRTIQIKSGKSLASRYYQLRCGHAPQQRISSDSGSKTTINAGGAERQPRRWSISSATARSGRTSGRNCREQSGGRQAEGGKVLACANIGAVLPRDVRSSGDGLSGGHGGREVLTPLRRVEVAAVFLLYFISV
jgi:hypothetical protein